MSEGRAALRGPDCIGMMVNTDLPHAQGMMGMQDYLTNMMTLEEEEPGPVILLRCKTEE